MGSGALNGGRLGCLFGSRNANAYGLGRPYSGRCTDICGLMADTTVKTAIPATMMTLKPTASKTRNFHTR